MKKVTKQTKMFDWEAIKQLKPEQLETIRKECKNGSDIDGVAVKYDSNVIRKNFYPNMKPFYQKARLNEYIKDKNIDVFITGRKFRYRKTTMGTFGRLGIQCKYIIFMPRGFKKTNLSLAEYKTDVINRLQLQNYYEDDKQIHSYLRSNCPNTEIVKVGGAPVTTLEGL